MNSLKSKGFTLIELAIVVMIIGLFVGVIAQGMKIYIIKKQNEELQTTIDNAEKAFADYRNVQGRFPCPAPRTGVDMGAPGDCTDTSIAVGDCVDGVCIAQGADGRRIRIGGIPFGDQDLSLSLADTVDPFGNQLTYAVTEHLATNAYAIGQGDIEIDIIDLQGNVTTKSGNEFTFFSHGRDGAGSYTANGILSPVECGVIGIDTENCNNDAIFTTTLATSDVNGSSHFDDALVHDLQFAPINLTCGDDEVITNVTNGVPNCENIGDIIGQYLSRTAATCPSGQVVQGFNISGQLLCIEDQKNSGGGGGGGGCVSNTGQVCSNGCSQGRIACDGSCAGVVRCGGENR